MVSNDYNYPLVALIPGCSESSLVYIAWACVCIPIPQESTCSLEPEHSFACDLIGEGRLKSYALSWLIQISENEISNQEPNLYSPPDLKYDYANTELWLVTPLYQMSDMPN